MIFGAGKGVTTLGVWGRSTGLIRWWIRNKTSRNRTMPNPRRALRLTLGIRMRLWSLLLSLRYWGWGFGFSIRRERSSPPSVEDLIRLRALRRPLPVIFRLGFMDAETFPQWSSESSQMVSTVARERERENGEISLTSPQAFYKRDDLPWSFWNVTYLSYFMWQYIRASSIL